MDVALEQMRCLANPGDDANQKIVCLRDAVHATAANTLGYKKRHNQDCFDENDGIITSLQEQKRAAFVKTAGDSDPKLAKAH